MNLYDYLEDKLSTFYEREEVVRTIEHLNLTQSVNEIVNAFKKQKMQTLDKAILPLIENADTQVKTIEDVKKRLKVYERNVNNYDQILKELQSNIIYPALIIHTPKHGYYLVAGNTRLMVSIVNDIPLKVQIVELED